jgi:predicted transcriptional regulator
VRGVSVRALDVLETDGGWLTTDGVVLLVGGSRDTVRKALWRLAKAGLVESRQVQLAQRGGGREASSYSGNGSSGYLDVRTEWRV